jgi:hypothetical protein
MLTYPLLYGVRFFPHHAPTCLCGDVVLLVTWDSHCFLLPPSLTNLMGVRGLADA